jgi:hypothetical protein
LTIDVLRHETLCCDDQSAQEIEGESFDEREIPIIDEPYFSGEKPLHLVKSERHKR